MILMFWQIFSFYLAAAEPRACIQEIKANPSLCLIGGALKPELHCQMSGEPLPSDSSYLKHFLEDYDKITCQNFEPLNHNNTLVDSKLQNHIQKVGQIKKECILSSMKRIPELDTPRRLTCENNNENPMTHTYWSTSKRKYVSTELCITDKIVSYVQDNVNDAISCVSQINQNMGNPPLDPALLFAKMNNESAFGFFLQSSAGIGITQLTSIAMKEMGPNHRGKRYKKALDKTTDASCNKLKEVMKHKIEFHDNSVRHCQIIGMGEGLMRNLFYGFSLLSHNRNTHGTGNRNSTKSYLKSKYKITDPEIVDMVNLITFGRNGFPGRNATLSRIKDNLKYKKELEKKLKNDLATIEKKLNSDSITKNDIDSLLSQKKQYLENIKKYSDLPNKVSELNKDQMFKMLMETSDYIRETFTKMCEFNKYQSGARNKNCSENEVLNMSYDQLKGNQCIEQL